MVRGDVVIADPATPADATCALRSYDATFGNTVIELALQFEARAQMTLQ
jgi:hypothetical protein